MYTTETSTLKASKADISKLNVKVGDISKLKVKELIIDKIGDSEIEQKALSLPNDYATILGIEPLTESQASNKIHLILNNDGTIAYVCNLDKCTNAEYILSDYYMKNNWVWSLGSIENATGFFYRTKGTFSFDAQMPNVTNTSWMFYQSDIKSFNCPSMPKVSNASAMFRESKLTSFNSPIHNVNRTQQMFQKCSSLSYFQQPDGEWNITLASNMFDGTKLEETSIPHVKKMLYNNKHTGTLEITIGVRNDMPTIHAVSSNFNISAQATSATLTNKNGGVWNITFQYN